MKEISVGILDENPIYAERLSRYLLLKARPPFSVRIFSNPQKAKEGLKEKPVRILIVSSGWMEADFLPEEDERTTFLLIGGRAEKGRWNCPFLYRYQSGEAICQSLRNAVCPKEEEAGVLISPKGGRAVGIYSPVGRCGKTAFSLALGLCLSRYGRTLFWSLDSPNGWEGLFGQSGTELPELFYYFRQGKSLAEPFRQRKVELQGMEILPAVKNPLSIREMAEEDVTGMAKALLKDTGCDFLVLDLGQQLCRPERILGQCDKVYFPVLEDEISRKKTEQCYRLLLEREKETLEEEWGRWERLVLPRAEPKRQDREGLLQLLWGRLGDLAEEKAKELSHGITEGIEIESAGTTGSGTGAFRRSAFGADRSGHFIGGKRNLSSLNGEE